MSVQFCLFVNAAQRESAGRVYRWKISDGRGAMWWPVGRHGHVQKHTSADASRGKDGYGRTVVTDSTIDPGRGRWLIRCSESRLVGTSGAPIFRRVRGRRRMVERSLKKLRKKSSFKPFSGFLWETLLDVRWKINLGPRGCWFDRKSDTDGFSWREMALRSPRNFKLRRCVDQLFWIEMRRALVITRGLIGEIWLKGVNEFIVSVKLQYSEWYSGNMLE